MEQVNGDLPTSPGASTLARRTGTAARPLGGPVNLSVGVQKYAQGVSCFEARDFSGALVAFNEAIEVFEAEEKPVFVAKVHMNLGLVHWQLNNLEEAAKYYGQALTYFTAANSPHEIASASLSLAGVLVLNKDYDAAEPLFLAAKAYYSSPGVANLKRVADTEEGLGRVYHTTKRLNEALEMFQRSKTLREELLDYRRVADCLVEIAETYTELGQEAEAKIAYHEAQHFYLQAGPMRV